MSVYFVKFEDLKRNTKSVLTEVFQFLFESSNLSGTIIEKRIDEVLNLDSKETQAYKMK